LLYDVETGDYTARLADELLPRVRMGYEAMLKEIDLDRREAR
jgi:hypothetical protein